MGSKGNAVNCDKRQLGSDTIWLQAPFPADSIVWSMDATAHK